ncbi:hypothetical protein [Sphingomonas kyungheensis]|uniref:AbrB family transcriptional regulator n=1 Tax=Sphingomonas kyungheensis TaxID=1069987 RepID=A0ABU8H756_9SPHN
MSVFIEYGESPRVRVDDGHVFLEASDGRRVRMKPEVAIKLGRSLEACGTESFINKVLDGNAAPTDFPAPK